MKLPLPMARVLYIRIFETARRYSSNNLHS